MGELDGVVEFHSELKQIISEEFEEPIWEDDSSYDEENISQHWMVPKPRFKPRVSAIELLDRSFYVLRSYPYEIPYHHEKVPFISTYSCGLTVNVAPRKLMAYLGSTELTDHYKVSQEYKLVSPPHSALGNPNWAEVNIYDWKSTSLYDSDLMSPGRFWEQREIEYLHLGHNKEDTKYAEALKEHLESQLGS